MAESTKWRIAAWFFAALALTSAHLGNSDARVSAGFVIAAIAFATAAIMKALGK